MAKAAEIYALLDPVTGETRYIGKANDARKRLATHLRDSRRRDTPVYRWIRKLASNGMIPALTVLCATDDWQQAEKNEIAKARAAGFRLLNVAEGGNEPFCPLSVRQANGRANSKKMLEGRLPNIQRLIGLLQGNLRFFSDRQKDHGDGQNGIEKTQKTIASLNRTMQICREAGQLKALDALFASRFRL